VNEYISAALCHANCTDMGLAEIVVVISLAGATYALDTKLRASTQD